MRFFVLLRRLCLLLLIAAGTPAFFPLILAAEEDATSASITLSGVEGAIPLQASATFATHTFCNGASPPDCWKSNSGTLTVSQKHPNGVTYHMASKSGEGSANWSTTLDGPGDAHFCRNSLRLEKDLQLQFPEHHHRQHARVDSLLRQHRRQSED